MRIVIFLWLRRSGKVELRAQRAEECQGSRNDKGNERGLFNSYRSTRPVRYDVSYKAPRETIFRALHLMVSPCITSSDGVWYHDGVLRLVYQSCYGIPQNLTISIAASYFQIVSEKNPPPSRSLHHAGSWSRGANPCLKRVTISRHVESNLPARSPLTLSLQLKIRPLFHCHLYLCHGRIFCLINSNLTSTLKIGIF